MTSKVSPILVTVNSSGRQAASLIRVASAVGWQVRAQLRDHTGLVPEELESLPNVTLVRGELTETAVVQSLFDGADMAFVNSTHWGNEVETGRALADSAKRAGIKHFVYSSMPDHASFGRNWSPLPMWKTKFEVEKYVRTLDMPSTFVYCGIYNNNFTTLPYPLFRLEMQSDGGFIWQAPFPPSEPLPWLDVEHDVGPALLQIFKEGPKRWAGHRIPIAFENASPEDVCASFSKALSRPVRYRLGRIEFFVPVPKGYKNHLLALEKTLGARELGFDQAPYFGPTMYYPEEAIELWEGNRSIEEYAREAFLVEERANGCTWMDANEEGDDADGSEGRTTTTSMGGDNDGTMSTPDKLQGEGVFWPTHILTYRPPTNRRRDTVVDRGSSVMSDDTVFHLLRKSRLLWRHLGTNNNTGTA